MHRIFKDQTGQASCILSLWALSTLLLGAPQVVLAQVGESPSAVTQASIWEFNHQTNQLRLTLAPGVAPRYFLLARPMRIAIEFPSSLEVSPASFQYDGAVEQLTVSPQDNGNLRLILQLRSGVELQPKQVALQQVDPSRWLITPLLVAPAGAAPVSSSPAAPVSPTATPALTSPAATIAPVATIPPALSNIPVGVDSIFEPPATGLNPERSFPGTDSMTQVPLTRPERTAPSTPDPLDNPFPTQIVELRPPASAPVAAPPAPAIERSTPSPQAAPISIPVSAPIPVSTPEPTVPSGDSNSPQTLAIQPSSPPAQIPVSPATLPIPTPETTEKPAPLATRPVVEPLEPIAPPQAASPSRPVTSSQSLPRPEPIAMPPAEPTRPPVTLSTVPLTPVPVTSVSPARSARATESTESTDLTPPNDRPAQPFNAQPQPQNPTQSITKLEFGQPLPISGRTPSTAQPNSQLPEVSLPLAATPLPGAVALTAIPALGESLSPTILLAKGSPIPLRYTGTVPLQIGTSSQRQEVLVVDEDIKSPQGQVIIPGGSQVIGHFETNWRGSRFIAQAISLGAYNQTIEAQSDRLGGDRSLNPLSIGAGSGTGAIAGTLIAGGFGALGGAAIGAVSGYFISPQSATLEPYQILTVYLAEDWLAN